MKKKLMVIGAGGHGRVIADAALDFYERVVFLDDDASKRGKEYFGCPVAGTFDDRADYKTDYDFIAAIGDNSVRANIQKQLENEGFSLATVIHSSAVIGRDVTFGKGTVVLANAAVNTGSRIGNGVIINTCASVDHDCEVGDFVHISPRAVLSGGVSTGNNTWICAGAVVINCKSICADCIIGAGATVINDIEQAGTYVGVPAIRRK